MHGIPSRLGPRTSGCRNFNFAARLWKKRIERRRHRVRRRVIASKSHQRLGVRAHLRSSPRLQGTPSRAAALRGRWMGVGQGRRREFSRDRDVGTARAQRRRSPRGRPQASRRAVGRTRPPASTLRLRQMQGSRLRKLGENVPQGPSPQSIQGQRGGISQLGGR